MSIERTYDPAALLDALIEMLKLRNDAALGKVLDLTPPHLSKIRHRRVAVSASVLIRMHEITGLSIQDLRDLMGDRRKKWRLERGQ